MSLRPGQSILHYRLGSKIGQGGMGEVWQATDTKLDRDVALKFLPDALTHDPERLERFTREARTLAALDHPGIASIHGLEEEEGLRFLVMELVPGQDLSEVLANGPLPLDEVLEIAVRIAEAVEVAHARGIVHRDLKPANVKRTPDGRIKVLDFGLAKVLGPEAASGGTDTGASPTLTSMATAAGVILGTAAYMSPEQARGRPVDKRTDVWSFGVLLHELLTGDNPFRGETVADSVGAILHRDPDPAQLPPGTPPAVRRVLRRCLARKRGQRLHDIADARIELEEAIAGPDADALAAAGGGAASPAARPSRLALAVLLPVVAALAWWLGSRPEPAPPAPLRVFELVPDAEPEEVVLSPDGSRLAYLLDGRVFVRSLDALEPRRLTTEGGDRVLGLFWSPDGRSLGLVRGVGGLERIDLDGGAPLPLTNETVLFTSLGWSEDGFIYFTRLQSGIGRLSENGGATEEVIPVSEDLIDYHGLAVLPGGRGFLTVPHFQDDEARRIVLERPGKERVVLFESDSPIGDPRYSATGHVLFVREDSPRGTWALPFSIESLSVEGEPFLVVPDLVELSVSNRGDMAYSKAALADGGKQQLIWVDRDGERVGGLDLPLYGASVPVMSPDGTRIAVVARGVGRPASDKLDLWVIDVERGSATRLTESGVDYSMPTWSPDGTRIAVLGKAAGGGRGSELIAVHADGSGEPEILLAAETSFHVTLTRDWSWAAYMSGNQALPRGLGIVARRLDDESTLTTVFDGPDQDLAPMIHPDGDWIAYASGSFGALDTYVQRFPEAEGRYKVSVERGGGAIWSPDGGSLYILPLGTSARDDPVLEVTFDGSGPRPVLGTPTPLFVLEHALQFVSVTPDGHFLHLVDLEPGEGEEAPDTKGIVLVENWLSRFAE